MRSEKRIELLHYFIHSNQLVYLPWRVQHSAIGTGCCCTPAYSDIARGLSCTVHVFPRPTPSSLRSAVKLASRSGRGRGMGMGKGMRRDTSNDNENSSKSRPQARLSLIARHFDQRLPLPLPELNTPFSSERLSVEPDDLEYNPIQRTPPPPPPATSDHLPSHHLNQTKDKEKDQLSNRMSSQPAHNTLLIPGPIEFDDAVLQSMSHYASVFPSPPLFPFNQVLTFL